jgi:hypothetical protein
MYRQQARELERKVATLSADLSTRDRVRLSISL